MSCMIAIPENHSTRDVTAKNGKTVKKTRPNRLRLKQDFQNCLWYFSISNIKKVTDLTYLTVWDRQKGRVTAKNSKTVDETRPDLLRLKRDFLNCVWNFSSSNIMKVTDFGFFNGVGPPKTAFDGQQLQKP